jgi:hypothetical protein
MVTAKIRNDPKTYKKRANLTRPAALSDQRRASESFSPEERAALVSSFGKAGNGRARFIPFGRIVGK